MRKIQVLALASALLGLVAFAATSASADTGAGNVVVQGTAILPTFPCVAPCAATGNFHGTFSGSLSGADATNQPWSVDGANGQIDALNFAYDEPCNATSGHANGSFAIAATNGNPNPNNPGTSEVVGGVWTDPSGNRHIVNGVQGGGSFSWTRTGLQANITLTAVTVTLTFPASDGTTPKTV